MPNLTEQMYEKSDQAFAIIDAAEAEGRDYLTEDENTRVKKLTDEARDLYEKKKRGEQSQALVDDLARIPNGDPGDHMRRPRGAKQWAETVRRKMGNAAEVHGVKALLAGQVSTPPAVQVAPLPDTPNTILDLIPREELDANVFAYLRQTARDSQAGPVADGERKPTSVFEFDEIEDRARVIAHLSEPFPIRYLDDHSTMVQVLEGQMHRGVHTALRDEIVNGTGTGESFPGILTLTGTTGVEYTGDVLTTLRRAVTIMQGLGEQPNAWVLNPTDAEQLSLTRENDTAGGFLFSDGFAQATVFGGVDTQVIDPSIPEGTALLADWNTLRVGVRQETATIAATQAGELFARNQVMLRSEGRFGLKTLRPQAIAVVQLTGTAG